MDYLPQRQNGQALIIVLLTLAVIMTVTLSIVSRSLSGMAVSTYETSALRAFSAAEAGIEKNLLNLIPGTVETDIQVGDAKYSASVQYIKTSKKTFTYPKSLGNGEVATFWLVTHDANGNLTCTSPAECFEKNKITIYWGTDGTTEKPAVEAIFFYDTTKNSVGSPNDYASVKFAHKGFDPDSVRAGNTGFEYVNSGAENEGIQYYRKADVVTDGGGKIIPDICDTAGCPIMLEVRMLYNSTPQPISFKVQGGTSNLPSQGITIASQGKSDESTRSLTVFSLFDDPLDPFGSAMFTVGSMK